MVTVTLHMLKPEFRNNMYSGVLDSQVDAAREMLARGTCYEKVLVDINDEHCVTAEDVAEEMFDLTNNPSRQTAREYVYGRGRSLSVGDLVELGVEMNNEKLLCCSFGWKVV